MAEKMRQNPQFNKEIRDIHGCIANTLLPFERGKERRR